MFIVPFFLKRLSPLQCMFLVFLTKARWLWPCGSNSVSSALFHWPTCQLLCQQKSGFVSVALQLCGAPASFFVLRIASVIQCLLWLPYGLYSLIRFYICLFAWHQAHHSSDCFTKPWPLEQIRLRPLEWAGVSPCCSHVVPMWGTGALCQDFYLFIYLVALCWSCLRHAHLLGLLYLSFHP